MSQRQFSALLGIGLASLQRREKGSFPTDTHAELPKKARNQIVYFALSVG